MSVFESVSIIFELIVSVVMLGLIPWCARMIGEVATLNANMRNVLDKLSEQDKDIARVEVKVDAVDRRVNHVEMQIAKIVPSGD